MIDSLELGGGAPPFHRRCGSTLGATCRLGSAVGRQQTYHAPCGQRPGHSGACFCPTCGTVFAIQGTWSVRTVKIEHRNREVAALTVYMAALALVAVTDTAMLPLAALTGAVSLRWGILV